jgi:hypothetical protein
MMQHRSLTSASSSTQPARPPSVLCAAHHHARPTRYAAGAAPSVSGRGSTTSSRNFVRCRAAAEASYESVNDVMTSGIIYTCKPSDPVDVGERVRGGRILLVVKARTHTKRTHTRSPSTRHTHTHTQRTTALEMLVEYRITGLPVVDDAGRVVREQ